MARSRHYETDARSERSQGSDDPQSRRREGGQDNQQSGFGQQSGYGRDAGSYGRPDESYPRGSGEDEFAQSRPLADDFDQTFGRGSGRGPDSDRGYGSERGYEGSGQRGGQGGFSGSAPNYGDPGYGDQSYGNPSYGNRGRYSGQERFSGGYGDQRSRNQGPADQGHERGFLERAGDELASWFGDNDAQRRRDEDHRGKGPKGYTRSDDRIRDDVNDHLSDDSWLDASDIEVSVEQGEVTLSGTVDSRQSKRRAEDCVDRIAGVTHVQNNLRVKSQSGSQPLTGTSLSADDTSGLGAGKASGKGNTQL